MKMYAVVKETIFWEVDNQNKINDYLKKISIRINVATDEGNSRNAI